MVQVLLSERLTHRTPAGLPSVIPGIGEEIEIAMQHAPHPGLQFIGWVLLP